MNQIGEVEEELLKFDFLQHPDLENWKTDLLMWIFDWRA